MSWQCAATAKPVLLGAVLVAVIAFFHRVPPAIVQAAEAQTVATHHDKTAIREQLKQNTDAIIKHNARAVDETNEQEVIAYNAVADRLGAERARLKALLSGVNVVGTHIVAQYYERKEARLKGTSEELNGGCYQVSYQRINAALQAAYGKQAALPILNAKKSKPFDRIWGSKNDCQNTIDPPRKPDPKSPWFAIEEKFRGTGAAGALVRHGIARMVDQHAIWQGKLELGAVLQTWEVRSDLTRVKQGYKPVGIGHSFVFLGYEKDESGKIIGMRIADQGTQWNEPNVLGPKEFEYWVGANIRYKE